MVGSGVKEREEPRSLGVCDLNNWQDGWPLAEMGMTVGEAHKS